MKILIIGGSYFLGKAYADIALKNNEITILNRGSKSIDYSDFENIEFITGDRHDEATLNQLEGRSFDVVVDFCAYNKDDINSIAKSLSTKQYIFISTSDVYKREFGKIIDESGELENRELPGEAGAYINGKVALEKELKAASVEHGFSYTSFRPAFIYGPGNYAPRETMYFNWLFNAGQMLLPSDSDGFFQMVYVKDMAQIIYNACKNEVAYNNVFNVTGDGLCDYDRFADALEACALKDVSKITLPVSDIMEKQIPLPFPLLREESQEYEGELVDYFGVNFTSFEDGLRESYLYYIKTSITSLVDSLYENNKALEAEKLMLHGLDVAKKYDSIDTQLHLYNELIGYYRVTSNKTELLKAINGALDSSEKLGLKNTVEYGTTLLNVANGYRSLGELDKSLEYYKLVLPIYKSKLPEDDMRVAGFYNNHSLLYQEMGRFEEAKECLLHALEITKKNDAKFEIAVTYANLANTAYLLKDYNDSKEYAKQSMASFDEMEYYDAHYSSSLSALGMCLINDGELIEARDVLKKGLSIIESTLGKNSQYERLKEQYDMCNNMLPEEDREVLNVEKEIMKGLELCKEFYIEYGAPMIHQNFPEYESQIAVGLVGQGSDCLGYDDEASRDHDWGPGFIMWVSKEVYEEIGEKLEECYKSLPEEYKGFTRVSTGKGSKREGVMIIDDFYNQFIGTTNYDEIDWSNVPDYNLLCASNGEVFRDDEGTFTVIRDSIKLGYPERIRFLKIAEMCAKYSQTVQYNYFRIMDRGDRITADSMICDGIKYAMTLQHYIQGVFPPHDKWLLASTKASANADMLVKLLGDLHSSLSKSFDEAVDIVTVISEQIASFFVKEMYALNIVSDMNTYLDYHTDEIIKKANYANDSFNELVDKIVAYEFEAFDKVKNEGGRAFCQNDWPTFSVMRKSQYLTWNRDMLTQYIYDFDREYQIGHNLITEKYGRMMESTAPEEYEKLEKHFEPLSDEKKMIIEQIVGVQMSMMEAFAVDHPKVAGNARTLHTYEDSIIDTSYETYLRGEISTYSDKMLQLYGIYVITKAQNGENIAREIIENTVELYGYKDMDDLERTL